MQAERKSVTLTTTDQGAATGYIDGITGRIITLIYTKVDFTDGVDLDITLEATGEVLLDKDDVNASLTVAPRQPLHSTAGAALLYAAGGTAVTDFIVAAEDRIKIVVGSGGDTKSGIFTVIVA